MPKRKRPNIVRKTNSAGRVSNNRMRTDGEQTVEDRYARLNAESIRQRVRRQNETPQQTEDRRNADALRKANARLDETPQQTADRHKANAAQTAYGTILLFRYCSARRLSFIIMFRLFHFKSHQENITLYTMRVQDTLLTLRVLFLLY